MGLLILKFVILLIMLMVLYQDMKFRAVSFILFPILFFLTAYLISMIKPFEMMVRDMLMIIGFITIQLAFITLYLLLKLKKVHNPFSGFIGTGDLLFWLAIAPLFSFVNFLLFFVLSLVFSAVIFAFLKIIFEPKSTTKARLIPLAGLQVAFLLLIFLLNQLFWQVEFHQGHTALTFGVYE